MNQGLLLGADSMNSTINTGEKKHTVTSHSDTKNEGQQAFSSELDKHIDKQYPAEKTTPPDAKQSPSQGVKGNDQHQRQAEESENKNGNALPDEQYRAKEVITQTAEKLALEKEQAIEKMVAVVDAEAEPDTDRTMLNGQHIGQQYTQELHNSVSQLKENLANTSPNAVVAETNKKLEKLVSAGVTIKQVAVVKQGADILNQTKQQQETPKIRPDILQALSARLAGKDSENSLIKSDWKTLLTAEQFVDKKTPFKELQLTELVKTMVPDKAQQASQLVDRGGNSLASTLVNIPVTTVTEPIARLAVPSLDIQPTVQSNAWSRVLSGRVIWMAREGIQQATLRLNPANLGPVEVKVVMHDEQVHVTFVAQHAATRDALEQALPRLRDSFIENGLEFADADVLQHDSEQADNRQTDNESVNAETEQSVSSEGVIGNEQQEVSTEQDIEVGVSLYA